MAEAILYQMTATLLGNIASPAMQEISLAWHVESDLEKLNSNLSAIHAVLQDAEDKRAKSRQLDDWLLKLRDFVYDAEDLIDEFQYEALRSSVLKSESTGRKVRNFFSSSNPLAFRHEMGRRMKALRERLDDISIEMSKFHYLTTRAEYAHVLHQRKMTHSFLRPSDVIGRDNDKERIIEHLLRERDGETVSIIPIVGIGGLGKTTLAKLVYNDDVVQKHFDLKKWVCVSEEFEITKVAKEITKVESDENVGDYTMEQAQTCLRDTLRGKRFLLILDDVWNEDRSKWVELKNLLLDGVPGSKIIVTTRIPLVASIMGSVPSHNLKGLPHKECVSLFVKWAFDDGQEEQYPNLMKIGNEIVKKCGGVPLAVRTLGSLLYLKTDERDWIAIRDNEIWRLEQHDQDGILPILRLSYEKLPSHLKLCFSYCSLFPKDYKFINVNLVQFWMAQGLIRLSDEGQELEDIGNRYINELWSRSFFQDVSVHGFQIIFKMHDLVHDLALFISKDEFLSMSTRTQSIPNIIRHVTFHLSCQNVPNILLNQNRLRTILFQDVGASVTSNSFVETCISRFKYLRTLDLGQSSVEVLSRSIGDFKHLRILDLSYNKSIKKLPKSICKLQNLKNLTLSGCSELEELPKDIGKYLISLRVLSVTTKQTSLEVGCLPTSLRLLQFFECENLRSLGEGMQRLTSLRTLWIRNCKRLERLPRGLNCSTTLENLVLEGLGVIDTMEFEEDEGDLPPSLRYLSILEVPKIKALPPWLQGSAHSLEWLVIRNCSELSTLPSWLQDFTSLRTLKIGRCPQLSALPEGMNHLTELRIVDCPELSALPEGMNHLTELWIEGCPELSALPEGMNRLTKLWIGGCTELSALPEGMNHLTELTIVDFPELSALPEGMNHLTELTIVDFPELSALPEGMNHLTKLTIGGCTELSALPEGMNHLTALWIEDCPELTNRCQPETGEDWPNIAHVPKITIDRKIIKSPEN